MKEIPLTRGLVALVDDEDYDRIVALGKWYAAPQKQTFYACRKNAAGMVYMHRFILDAATDVDVDHQNGNGLDNRRQNIRTATDAENARNTRRPSARKTSRYRGVHRWRHPRMATPYWKAQIRTPDRRTIVRYCKTEEEAARIYNDLAREHHGDFAVLNEVPA